MTFSLRLTSVVALSALLVSVGGGAFAAPLTPDSGPTAGGTSVSGTVPGLVFSQVSAGNAHSLAVGSDRKTYAWGYNLYGQLGINSTTNSSVPVAVQTPTGVTFTQVSAGSNHSLAVGSDGKVYAWGFNSNGRLGNNSTTSSPVPVAVQTPTGVTFTEVSAGNAHSVAVGSDGKTYAWGGNSDGQLGNNSTTDSPVPVAVQTPAGVTFTQVSAGFYHSLALGSDGITYAWGDNGAGRLGNNSTTDSPVPVAVTAAAAGVTLTQISAGNNHSLALGSDGKTYAWGRNDLGQLGNNSTTDSSVPVGVTAPAAGVTLTQVSAGSSHSSAVGSDGKTYAWGWNGSGQLGNNSTTNSSVPLAATEAAAGVTLTQVSAGGSHVLAVGSDGKTYAWGWNAFGQLGNNSTTNSSVPAAVEVPVIAEVPVITAVNFDGVAGTGLTQSSGSWTVNSPAHTSGAVDVVVSYTWLGAARTETKAGGFTFGAAPLVTVNPISVSAVSAEEVVLTAGASGDETPTVQWQSSTDQGASWTDIASATATSYTSAPTATRMFRAVFTNGRGSVSTSPATITITTATASADADAHSSLARTGSSTPHLTLGAALLLLVLGGVLLVARRRHNHINTPTSE